jgi:hypothetical protein
MKVNGRLLILLGILGIAIVLTDKTIRHSVQFIGPKSLLAFIICGILIVTGILLLLRKKTKKK